MSYDPKPVDTSQVDASILAPVTEQLAEHVHDLWAQSRIREGWTFGSERDGQTKKTPSLVPYGALPDAEKDYDRRSAIEPLKVLLARGYSLSPPGQTPETAVVSLPTPKADDQVVSDDMLDGPDPVCAHPALADALRFVSKETFTAYTESNGASSRFQDRFRWAALSSVFAAVLSVLIAIWQLAFPPRGILHYVLPGAELILVVLALGTVVCASFYQKWHLRWLTERSKAERLRVAKFRFLLDPRTWDSGNRKPSEADFRERVRTIESAVPDTLPVWLTETHGDAAPPAQLTRDRLLHEAIAEYYLQRRLASQAKYFKRKSHQMHSDDGGTKIGGYVLYFLVLVFVFSHAATDVIALFRGHDTGHNTPDHTTQLFSRVFIMCAAMLPAMGAAVHTYRAGRETARNHLRFETCYQRLSAIQADLEQSDSQPEQIRLMYASEAVLSSEHQQWLQLMYECEWFG